MTNIKHMTQHMIKIALRLREIRFKKKVMEGKCFL